MFGILNQVAYSLGVLFGLWFLSRIVQAVRAGRQSTPLRGPPRNNLFFGLSRYIQASPDSSVLFERWAEEYGPAYRVPYGFGSFQVVLTDPKAVASFFAQGTSTYVRNSESKRAVERLVGLYSHWGGLSDSLFTQTGQSLLVVEGEIHKRQRKTLNPAFNNAAIRKLTPVFFDSAYKVKNAWDGLIDSSQSSEAVIDIQSWMNRVSLDTIGIAGFSYDFRSLSGEISDIQRAFGAFFGGKLSLLDGASLLLANIFPIIDRIPTARKKSRENLSGSLRKIAVKLLADSEISDPNFEDKSIIGLLLKDKNRNVELHSYSEEVVAQMKLLLVAGYTTTSVSLIWALVELAQRTDVQTKLREEFSQFSTADPTWDQLSNSLPYLDAVIHEILRLHPPLIETTRIATRDNVLPLSTPVQTRDGKFANSLAISKGTTVKVSMRAINRSEAFWGPDAKEFKPERWLSEAGLRGSKEILGHRHLLTFADGPRLCLGKGFALAELKAVLCTLIRNFSLNLQEGAKVVPAGGISRRPKIAGQEGRIPICVRRIE